MIQARPPPVGMPSSFLCSRSQSGNACSKCRARGRWTAREERAKLHVVELPSSAMRRIVLSLIVLSYAVVATAAPSVMPPASGGAPTGAHAPHAAAVDHTTHSMPAASPCSDEHAPAQQDCCDDGGSPAHCSASCVCPSLAALPAPAPGIAPLLVIAVRQAAPVIASPSLFPPLLFRPPIA